MALPSKTIESMEQIAEKLERWANDKKRHRMLCNGLPNLGCRVSLNEPLRGFGTILLKAQCWRPDAARSLEKEHKRLLSLSKEIDQKIKEGRRDLVFSASALQLSGNILAKKLRIVGEGAREDLSLEKEKNQKSRSIKKCFDFESGGVFFDGHDLNLGTGAAREIIRSLVDNFGKSVPFQKLDENTKGTEASEKVRTAIKRIRKAVKSVNIPVVIVNRKAEGYVMLPSTT